MVDVITAIAFFILLATIVVSMLWMAIGFILMIVNALGIVAGIIAAIIILSIAWIVGVFAIVN